MMLDISSISGARITEENTLSLSSSSGDKLKNDPIMASAKEFEAVFIKQMLQYAGLADAFGAGQGTATDTFSSYVLDHVAENMVAQGGFGLAEQFYEKLSLKAQQDPSQNQPVRRL